MTPKRDLKVVRVAQGSCEGIFVRPTRGPTSRTRTSSMKLRKTPKSKRTKGNMSGVIFSVSTLRLSSDRV